MNKLKNSFLVPNFNSSKSSLYLDVFPALFKVVIKEKIKLIVIKINKAIFNVFIGALAQQHVKQQIHILFYLLLFF